MTYAEFLLRRRAAAMRQLSRIMAAALSQGGDGTQTKMYLAELENMANGR